MNLDKCPHCQVILNSNEILYSDEWDSHYCSKCNNWLEDRCSVTKEQYEQDPWGTCHFKCFERPKKPV